jgi:hypothetical protein
MSHWLTHHGVWRGDIHWLGDLAGIAVAVFFVVTSKPQNRRLVASVFIMLSGYSSIPDVLRTNDMVVATYHTFFVILAIVATPIFFRELPSAASRWWHEIKGDWKQSRAAKRRLREAQAARREAEARLARAKASLAEAIEFGEEIEQAKRDRDAGRPFTLNGRVFGHEEIK